MPEGSAGDAALSARLPVTRLRSRRGAVTLPRTSPRHRSGTARTVDPTSQLGWLPGASALVTPTDRPANRPATRGDGWWHSSRAPAPLTPTSCPKQGGPDRFPWTAPRRVIPTDSAPRPRSALRSPVRRTDCPMHHTRSRGIFQFTGKSPELSRYPQETPRHPPFMHTVAHSDAARGDSSHPVHTPPSYGAMARRIRSRGRRGTRKASARLADAGAGTRTPALTRSQLTRRRVQPVEWPGDLADQPPLRRRDHHHHLVHVARPRARRSRPPGGFFGSRGRSEGSERDASE